MVSGEPPLLHQDFLQLPAELLDRELHSHQADALEAMVRDGQNAIVAAGTGSGKTPASNSGFVGSSGLPTS